MPELLSGEMAIIEAIRKMDMEALKKMGDEESADIKKAIKTDFICARCGAISEKQPRRIFRFMRQAKADIFSKTVTADAVHRMLSSTGKSQARAAAIDLADTKGGEKIRVIVTSPTEGAVGTANIFAKQLNVPVIRERRLMERDMGDEFREKLNKSLFEKIMRREYCPPGLSPLGEFENETISFLGECATDPRLGTDILFVTHTLRIMTLVKIIKGWEPKMMANWQPPRNCGMLVFGTGPRCKRKKCGGFIYELAA